MDLNKFNKTTFLSALGHILKDGAHQGVKFDAEEIESIAIQGIERKWIEPEWYTSRGGVFTNAPSQSPVAEKDISEVKDKDLIGKIGFQNCEFDDAALARLYLYKLNSCLERRISWELSLGDLRKIAKRKTCYYSGQKIVNQTGHRNRMTLDRLDASKGYTKENTVACCHWVNQLKGELFENSVSKFATDKKTLLKILSKIED